jgi:peptidoglycan/xylan/chitin deacetylase (PgdA/CDA1 family)
VVTRVAASAWRIGGALLIGLVALALPALAYHLSSGPGPVAKQDAPPAVAGQRVAREVARVRTALDARQAERGIPVLTYHGVAEQGGPYAVTPEDFAEQMAALDRAGYHTVSMAQFDRWQRGLDVALPSAPILITFDDGIKSVWIHADRILAQHHFKATMFVITGRVGTHAPYYLSWPEIERMRDSGRWSLESHTDDGHRTVPIGPSGKSGAFLTHRMWLDGPRRLETMAEFRKRLSDDLARSVAELRRHGAGPVGAFAFPFSTSDFPTNDPRAPAALKEIVQRRFTTVVDNVSTSSSIPPNAGKRYLPRIEILRGQGPRGLLAKLARARPLAPQLPPPGKESVYSWLERGDVAAADLLLADRWKLPRYAPVTIRRLTWREDPYGEQYWRFGFYGLRPLTDLLWAFRTTGDVRYRDKLLAITRSFVAADDARRDRRRSGLDRRTWDYKYGAAIRTLVLVDVQAKLRQTGDLPRDVDAGIDRALRRLGAFLAEGRNFDVGNNHGFGEATAQIVLAANHPSMPGAARWRVQAGRRLSALIDRNVDAGGVQVERSPFYHFYVLRLASELTEWARRSAVELPAEFLRRTESMVRYATFVTRPDGTIPLQGSSVAMDVSKLDPEVFAALGERFGEFEYARTGGLSGTRPRERNVRFLPSGDGILRSGWGTAEDDKRSTHMTFNVGPYRTAHAHHDALAVTYYGAGRPLLVDSGLFTYEHGTWFDYFKSTAAHNTITVDGRDQRRGPVRAGLLAQGPGWSYQSGSQALLQGGTEQRRSVVLLGRDVALVLDDVLADRERDVAQHWHLWPDATLRRRGALGALATESGKPQLGLWEATTGATTLEDRSGDTAPIQGWYSSLYGKKRPAHALAYRTRAQRVRFATLIGSGRFAAAKGSVRFAWVDDHRLDARVCAGGRAWQVVVREQARPGERVAVRRTRGC